MGRKIALLVGSGKYADARLRGLESTSNDLSALAKVLRDVDVCGFDVKILENPQFSEATHEIYDLYYEKNEDDLILFYYSGHGIVDAEGRFYLPLIDSKWDRLPITAVRATDVNDWMGASRSLRQLVILDCCHAGAFPKNSKSSIGGPALTSNTFDVRGYGREILTATAETALAFEGDNITAAGVISKLGIFTSAIVEGLSTGDAAADKDEISIVDLFNYAYRTTVKKDPRMQPRHWRHEASEPIIIARNRHPVDLRRLKIALNSENEVERLGAIDAIKRQVRRRSQSVTDIAVAALIARQRTERDREVYEALTEAIAEVRDSATGQLSNGHIPPNPGGDTSSAQDKARRLAPPRLTPPQETAPDSYEQSTSRSALVDQLQPHVQTILKPIRVLIGYGFWPRKLTPLDPSILDDNNPDHEGNRLDENLPKSAAQTISSILGWFALVAFLAGAGSLIGMRESIMNAWPRTRPAFSLLGFDVPSETDGLFIENVRPTWARDSNNNDPVLVVEGRIRNGSNGSRQPPRLRGELRDGQRVIYTWTFSAGETLITPNGSVNFRTQLRRPANAAAVSVVFDATN